MLLILISCMLNAESNSSLEKVSAGNVRGLFSWVRHGSLLLTPIPTTNDVVYIYKNNNGQCELVSGSVHAIQEMIDAELSAQPGIRNDVLGRLDELLFELMSCKRDSLEVNQGVLYDFEEDSYHKRLMRSDEQMRATYRQLSKCVEETRVKHDDVSWSVSFFVYNPDGSLEQWSASGSSQPFAIKKWRVDEVLSKGNLRYLPRPYGSER